MRAWDSPSSRAGHTGGTEPNTCHTVVTAVERLRRAAEVTGLLSDGVHPGRLPRAVTQQPDQMAQESPKESSQSTVYTKKGRVRAEGRGGRGDEPRGETVSTHVPGRAQGGRGEP